VWERDQGRCQWPVDGGGVCGSTVRVELHHIIPWAHGGPTTVENLECACGFHNQLAAREDFGDDLVDRYARRPPSPAPLRGRSGDEGGRCSEPVAAYDAGGT
jgi:hypothetical protein